MMEMRGLTMGGWYNVMGFDVAQSIRWWYDCYMGLGVADTMAMGVQYNGDMVVRYEAPDTMVIWC